MDRILITACINQRPEILKHYLQSLDDLIVDDDLFKVDKYFVLHNCYDELKDMFNDETRLIRFDNDVKYKVSNDTHHWKYENFTTLATMKNEIVDYSLKNEYDYTFWVDSDLILHPLTLIHLYKSLKKLKLNIMSEVFWTKWNEKDEYPGTNAWQYDQYGGNQAIYLKSGIHKVGGTGALILINNDVYRSGVNYSYIENVTYSIWEDRAFSIRAMAHGYNLYMDTQYQAFHIYRDADLKKYLESIK